MKLYVACSSERLDVAAAAMSMLKEAGHEITFNWIDYLIFNENGDPAEASNKCLAGVDAADRLVMMLTYPRVSPGAWFEFGYAIRAGKPVNVILGEEYWRQEKRKRLIFTHCPQVKVFGQLKSLVSFLNGLEGSRNADPT